MCIYQPCQMSLLITHNNCVLCIITPINYIYRKIYTWSVHNTKCRTGKNRNEIVILGEKYSVPTSSPVNSFTFIHLPKLPISPLIMSTAVDQVVACAPDTQKARVRSPIRTSFLGEVFSGFFLTCKTNVGKL